MHTDEPAVVKEELIEDQLGVSFRDAAYLQRNVLSLHNVLDYFALSEFYDRTCNNALCVMQRVDLSQMVNMTGVEYVVFHAHEPSSLFVVRKQRRSSPELAEHLLTYYIINGTVFQAPSLGAVLSSRILKSLHYARRALRSVEQHSTFSTTHGYTWDHVDLGDTQSHRLTEDAQRAAAFKAARSTEATPFNVANLFQRIDRIETATAAATQSAAAATAATAAAAAAPTTAVGSAATASIAVPSSSSSSSSSAPPLADDRKRRRVE
jgi:hypothetical protein